MRYAEIKNNIVLNIIEAEPGINWPFDSVLVLLEENEWCDIGCSFDSNENPRFFTEEESIQGMIFTSFEFMMRLTPAERSLIRSTSLTDENVADFLQLAQSAQEIDTSNSITLQAMGYLVSIGIFTDQRKNEILGIDEINLNI